MFSHQDNLTITGVSPGTPLHEPLARFWYPVLQSHQLDHGHTSKIRLLGENFVVAREGSTLIALEEACPHRQASMALARVEPGGLRCIYHGWLVGRDGKVAETPNETESGTRRNIKVRAPAVREAGGLIWMNVCEDESQRAPFPNFPWMNLPEDQVVIADVIARVNWTQSLEGAIDSSHSSHLHSDQIVSEAATRASTQVMKDAGYQVLRPSLDKRPRLRVQNTGCGFAYAALRTPINNPDTMVYVRVTAFGFPGFVNIPASTSKLDMQIFVPMDETHTHFVFIRASRNCKIDRTASLEWSGLVPGRDIDESGCLRLDAGTKWGQDRAAMLAGKSFSGIRGTSVQDFAVQESMGAIVDRTRENLGPGDVAIAHFRRLLLASAKGEFAGDPGYVSAMRYEGLLARDGLLPIEQDWTTLFRQGEVNWLTGKKTSTDPEDQES